MILLTVSASTISSTLSTLTNSMHKRLIASCIMSLLVITTSSFAKAPPIQLATNYRDNIIIQNYYVSEN